MHVQNFLNNDQFANEFVMFIVTTSRQIFFWQKKVCGDIYTQQWQIHLQTVMTDQI